MGGLAKRKKEKSKHKLKLDPAVAVPSGRWSRRRWSCSKHQVPMKVKM